jgi:hypothetical protein
MTVALSIVLAAALTYAALRKLGHSPNVVASYARVGVPEGRLNALATILLAGASGLIAGLFWSPIGTAAAIGLVTYFALAVGAHIRFHDERNLPVPVVILALAIVVLALHTV